MTYNEKKIAALFLIDGMQLTALLTIIPFILFGSEQIGSIALSSSVAISGGIFIGSIGTLVVGHLSDSYSATRILQTIQIWQALTILALCFFINSDKRFLSMLFAAISIVLSRSSGPAKDKLRSVIVRPSIRQDYNVKIRQAFLFLNQFTLLGLTLTFSLIDSRHWAITLVLVLLFSFISICLVNSLQNEFQTMPKKASCLNPCGNTCDGTGLNKIVTPLVGVFILSLLTSFPTVGLAVWIQKYKIAIPLLAGIIGTISTIVDIYIINKINVLLKNNRSLWGKLFQIGGLLSLLCVTLTIVSFKLPGVYSASAIILLAVVCSSIGNSIAVMISMEIQYGFGSHVARGRISSFTRTTTSVAGSLSAYLTTGIFLYNWIIIVCIIMCLLPVIILGNRIKF